MKKCVFFKYLNILYRKTSTLKDLTCKEISVPQTLNNVLCILCSSSSHYVIAIYKQSFYICYNVSKTNESAEYLTSTLKRILNYQEISLPQENSLPPRTPFFKIKFRSHHYCSLNLFKFTWNCVSSCSPFSSRFYYSNKL